jgi:opacity protein-like surface antigen
MKKCVLLVSFLILFSLTTFSQIVDNTTINILPGVDIPFTKGESSEAYYKVGAFALLSAQYNFSSNPLFFVEGGLAYHYAPTKAESFKLNLVTLGIGGGVQINIREKMEFQIGAEAGGYLGVTKDTIGANPYVGTSLSMSFDISPAVSLSIGSRYRYFLTNVEGLIKDLYQGLSIHFGTNFSLGGGTIKPNIQIDSIRIDPVFPVFHAYYNTNPLGEMRFKNIETGTISDVIIKFHVPEYMDNPKVCARYEEISAGEEVVVPLYLTLPTF